MDIRLLAAPFGDAVPAYFVDHAAGFITRDASGRGIARSDGRPPDNLTGQESFFQKVLHTAAPLVSTNFSANFQQAIFSMTAPAKSDAGQVIGVVGIAIKSDRVARLINQIHPTPGTTVYLTDASGHAIAHPDQNLVASFADLSSAPVVARILASPADRGIATAAGPNGETLAAYTRVPDLDGFVVVERPVAQALATLRVGRSTAFGLLAEQERDRLTEQLRSVNERLILSALAAREAAERELQMRLEMRKTRDELETRVGELTKAVAKAGEDLRAETEARRRAEGERDRLLDQLRRSKG